MSYHTLAIDSLRECTALAPNHGPALRKLAQLLHLAGEDAQADEAEAAAQRAAGVEWVNGSDVRASADLEKAERKRIESLKRKPEAEATNTLREHLIAHPLDAVAIRWLARLEIRGNDRVTARTLFERALDLCPGYIGAREDLAQLLIEERQYAALAETTRLLSEQPGSSRYLLLHAHALIDSGKPAAAIDVLVRALREDPNDARSWRIYAAALLTAGRGEESVQAYRKCLDLDPAAGEAWWGLSEMKDKVLTEDDVEEMRAHLDDDTVEPERRMHMLYALGQTLERAGEFAKSFEAYEKAAREFWVGREKKPREEETFDSHDTVQRTKTAFSSNNFATRLVQAPAGNDQDTPIFVVGMPRAGSTLVEQILTSHSRIEAIGERPLVGEIQRELAFSRLLVEREAYPDCVLELTAERFAELGARVMARSRDYRTTARPYFVDKRPWNWLAVGLIHLMLPQAKIIDIRREPMAACFAMYKQLLPRYCTFSYDLKEVGRYYNRYVKLMEHWETVLPGRVHFIQYENLVQDTEFEIRRMLAHCGLPFEEGCLRFWETERSIVTPSAEQVRRPIYRGALEQWRNFEPWLDPLKEALGEPVEL
ncbi:MAG TPA: sulfotransferase [Rhizomicrobium sp.]|jgi:tetratricopeptide (TPR) repeat protein|nr:sulfotransferase [Rhizomicrobium sp.]